VATTAERLELIYGHGEMRFHCKQRAAAWLARCVCEIHEIRTHASYGFVSNLRAQGAQSPAQELAREGALYNESHGKFVGAGF
jgi:hypothetical protein